MTQTSDSIHVTVRERYAAKAKTGSCCDSSHCCQTPGNKLYPLELLDGLPKDITDFSLGLREPIAIASLNKGETVLDLGSGGGLDCFLAAKQVGETGHVIGVDMTPEMIKRRAPMQAR